MSPATRFQQAGRKHRIDGCSGNRYRSMPMRFIEEVQIPLFILPPPESCRLVRWRFPDGAHVTMGEVIYELEVNEKVYEVESFYTGFMKVSGIPGTSYKMGDSIGTVVCDTPPDENKVIGIELTPSYVAKLDECRGKRSRREYLEDLVRAALTSPAGE